MRTEPRPAKNQNRLARHKLRDARTSCPQIKPRLEEKAGGGTEQRRTANTARKGETSQISPVGDGTPHQQTPTAETRTQIRGFDPRKHTPYVREHQETPNTSLQRQRQANGIGGGFAYLNMSNADAGFDGLEEAMSRATATASAEPRIESASSTPPPVLVLQSPVHSFLSPGSASRPTDQPSRPTKPTRDRRERRFLRNLTARTEQRGAESRSAHSNSEEKEQSLKKGRGFIVSTLPAMPSTLRTYSRLCHLYSRTGVHLRGSGTPVVIANADGHFRNPNAVA